VSPSKRKRPTTGRGGAKAGKGGAKRLGKFGGGRDEARRLGLLVFGVTFLVLFVAVAIAEGLGDPSIPSGSIAVVQEVPDGAEAPFDKPYKDCEGKEVTQDLSEVTQAEFKCAFQQVVASSGLKKTPKPREKQYGELTETTDGSILETIWIQGLAAEEGITVTEDEVDKKLGELKKQNFKTEAEFQKFLKTSHYTTQDVNERVKIQILSEKIQEQLGEGAGEPSKSEIKDYYEEAKASQFTTPPTVDARILIAKTAKDAAAAKAALLKDNSPDSWKAVVKKYSESASPNGGLQPGVTEEQYAGEVGEALFSAPPKQVEGPIKYATSGFVVFEVQKKNDEKVQPLGEAEAQIKAQLQQQQQEAVFGRFVSDFQGLWRSRTFCADGYVVEKCPNFTRDGRPAEADPACYEANPKTAPEACPAPVGQAKPALPGSVSLLTPKGEQLAQRPRPAGLEASPEGFPGSIEGLPPGVSTEGAPPPTSP
jgi:parvulin-like peptidyl-prolyl isomerase